MIIQTPQPRAHQNIIARRPSFSVNQIGGYEAMANIVFITLARIPESSGE